MRWTAVKEFYEDEFKNFSESSLYMIGVIDEAKSKSDLESKSNSEVKV